MFWFLVGLAWGASIGLVVGAFLWTNITLREVERRRKLALAAKRLGAE